jgi:O-antigen chain-terminating methyltransferase
MINRCQDKGLSVQQCDGLQYLANLGSGVLGGVVAVQVVEHLRVDQLKELIRLCAGKVRKGGIVIFETINPQSLVALSSNYFRDPTHVAPLHPDTLAYLMQLGGLANPQVSFLSPFASSENLPAIENEEFFSPRWQRVIRILNAQTAQLNKLLYGYQDYCIVAEVP